MRGIEKTISKEEGVHVSHIIGLGLKFSLMATVLIAIFSVLSPSLISSMLGLTVILVVTSYLFGDLFMVKRFGNVAATIADFGLALIMIAGLGIWLGQFNFLFLVAAVSAAFLIAVGESFFHFYVQTRITDERMDIYEEPKIVNNGLNTSLQTEFSNENDIHHLKQKK